MAFRSNYHLYRSIKGYLKYYKVNVALAFITRANILTTLSAKLLKIPVIISDRNNPIEKDNVLATYWIWLRKLIYPMANFVVLQTEEIGTFYKSFVPIEKLRIIANPINPDFDLSDSISWEYKENIVLNVGRLDLQKNHAMLIEAFSQIDQDSWQLVIVGEGKERANLEKLIQQKKVGDKIRLLGRKKNIEEYYRKSKIFAFTSSYEGFPNALLEAMSFGLASISTNCPTGPSELISNEKNGFLIPVGDVEELKSKMEFLINNSEQQLIMGLEAQSSVQKYKMEFIEKEWLKLIDSFHNI